MGGPAPEFAPRVAAASLSGASDAAWAGRVAEHVGAAFLGGVCVDEASRAAAAAMVADRDREEFLPEDPFAFIDDQLEATRGLPLRVGVNVRATEPAPVGQAATLCAKHGAILEVNAHCRQAELCDAGCGETLLADGDRLTAFVRAAASTGAPVSVKVRAEVDGVDLAALAPRLRRAGAAALHVDAMDSPAVIERVSSVAPELFLIANNGVRDRETAEAYLRRGADAVSLARPTDRPTVLARVRRAVDDWFAAATSEPG